jgi:23S rRNA (cytidine1920-2'-O)/16S rRNA (cytidine1409-2'-O)-methyltransferase
MKDRADKLLVDKGLAESRNKAKALIMAGLVKASGKRVKKAGDFIAKSADLTLDQKPAYVGRGGIKLEKALDEFKIDVRGISAADIGASTGGFTDCLLQRGAQKVYAVDVDTRQIDWKLRNDPRVMLIQKNARFLEKDDLDEEIQLVTMDLSFISVLKVLPAVRNILRRGEVISLIKPQFEAGRSQVGKNGIIKNPSIHEEVLDRVVGQIIELGLEVLNVTESPVKGQKGNREFFLLCSVTGKGPGLKKLTKLIKEAIWNEKD